jgi:hypothetical protein
MQDMNNNWRLMLCELHNPVMHGKNRTSDPNIETHYLVFNTYNPITKISSDYYETDYYDVNRDDYDDIDDKDFSTIYEDMKYLKDIYANPHNYVTSYYTVHPTIRNYRTIVSSAKYIKPEIGEYIILPTQEAVAILKTFWLRIIQKKWKKVFQERKKRMQMLCEFSNLKVREMRDKNCLKNLPGLKGMLSELKMQ